MNFPAQLRAWLQGLLGDRYPVVVKAVDGAATAFLLVFFTTFAAHGIDTQHITEASTWKAAALAGLVAAVNAIKSAVMIAITGQPALGGLVSNQLRAQRDARPVRHPVPLRKPRPTRAVYRPEHEAPTDKRNR